MIWDKWLMQPEKQLFLNYLIHPQQLKDTCYELTIS